MALRMNETIEAFFNEIVSDAEIMNIMKLPTILKTDSQEIINKKKKLVIGKAITKTAQEPYELGKDFKEEIIDGIKYSGFGKTRMTISLAQSIKLSSDLFGRPQIDINIYYDNTNLKDVFKLLDLISDKFSGKKIKVKVNEEEHMIKDVKCEVITSQIPIINNYERVGMRFSFYSTLYKN